MLSRFTGLLTMTGATLAAVALASCMQAPNAGTAPATGSQSSNAASANSAADECKDFPVVMYSPVKSAQCEKSQRAGMPLRYTAYLESLDSVAQVTQFYRTQVQSSGWTVDPSEVEDSTHSVVSIKKGKAYASIIINAVAGAGGSRFQIHAYPNGNDVE